MILDILKAIGAGMYEVDGGARIILFLAYGALCALFFLKKITDKQFVVYARMLFWAVVAWFISEIVLASAAQYIVWDQSPLSRMFLPPHEPLSYFVRYAWLHFAQATTLSSATGVLFFFLFALGNDISKGRFFYEDEEYTGAVAILLNPWPTSLLVLPLVLCAGIGVLGVRLGAYALKKSNHHAPLFALRMLWPLAGLVVFLFGNLLSNLIGLGMLKA